METLVDYIAKGLVAEPDAVEVTKTVSPEDDGLDLYELHVAGDDMGKVIGRNGRTVRAMRTVVRAAAARVGRRANLEIPD